jgi:hypothetical protein
MDDQFELLEQRVQKAAARLRELKAENATLRAEALAAAARAEKAERGARAAVPPPPGVDELAQAQATTARLTAEREEIKNRIRKLLELLERLE